MAPKHPHSTFIPRESRIIFVMKKEMLSKPVPRADRRAQYAEQQADSAGELDEWKGPSEADRELSRQYVQVVHHGDRVMLDVHELSER